MSFPRKLIIHLNCGPVLLDVVFTAPLLLDDLDRMSMPVNYISWQVRSADQKKHEVRVSVEAFFIFGRQHGGSGGHG